MTADLTPAPTPSAAVPDPADVELVRLGRLGYRIAQVLGVDPTDEIVTRLLSGPLAAARPSPNSEAVARVATALDWIADNVEDDEGFVSADDLRVMAENAREGLDLFAPRAALGTGDREGRRQCGSAPMIPSTGVVIESMACVEPTGHDGPHVDSKGRKRL